MSVIQEKLKSIIEAAVLATGQPIHLDRLLKLFIDEEKPSREDVRNAIKQLQDDYADRGMELIEVSSGYRIQARQDYSQWVSRLWEEKPARYSRALLETLVLIAYKQPITRGEIENVRGVSVSSNIIKTLQEREWVRVVGHRDVPGKPAIYATTRQFLDYFNLKSLDQLPTLSEIRDLDKISKELEVQEKNIEVVDDENLEQNDLSSNVSEEYSSDATISSASISEEDFDQQHIAQELKEISETIKVVDHEAEVFIAESENTISEITSETDLSQIDVKNAPASRESAAYSDPNNPSMDSSMDDSDWIVEITHKDVISE